ARHTRRTLSPCGRGWLREANAGEGSLSAERTPHPARYARHLLPQGEKEGGVCGDYRPLKFATRRSAVAFTPSLKSSVERSRFCSTNSWLVAASTRSARLPRMVARVETRPSGEHSAISPASFIAAART